MNKNDDKLWDSYNNLLISDDINRIRKMIARYELYKKTIRIPGDIVECGVFKGAGLLLWLKYLLITTSGSSKRVIGFDTFNHFSDNVLSYEEKAKKEYVEESNFSGASIDELLSIVSSMGDAEKVELVMGEFEDTSLNYKKNNPGFRISLLNLDFDTYSGTLAALNTFYELVTPGGVIIFDEYGQRGWGESDAVDEFFKDKEENILTEYNFNSPSAYIIKK
jgi:hypothetical protein